MEVYMLQFEHGKYDDEVVGIFSSRDLAKAAEDEWVLHSGYAVDYRISTYTLDQFIGFEEE